MRLWILRMELQVLAWWCPMQGSVLLCGVKKKRFAASVLFVEAQAILFGLSLAYDFGFVSNTPVLRPQSILVFHIGNGLQVLGALGLLFSGALCRL